MVPIIKITEDAKGEFLKKYGFPAERLHVSPMVEGALQRLWRSTIPGMTLDARLKGMEFTGLEVVKMTRRSALVEMYLSATRDAKIHVLHVLIEPEELGLSRVSAPEIELDSGFGAADQ